MARTNTKEALTEEYWLKKLAGEPPPIALPYIGKNQGENRERRSYIQPIPPRVSANLARTAKHSEKALFILILSGLQIALHRYTGIADLLIGTMAPAANEAGKDRGVIFCRNTVLPQNTVKEFIVRTGAVVMEAINYSGYSLENLEQVLAAKKGTGTPDIFKVAFLYQPFQQETPAIDRFGMLFKLSASQPAPGMQIEVKYPHTPTAQEIVRRFSRNLITLLEHMLENLDRPLTHLEIIGPEEKNQLLYEFNETKVQNQNHKTIHQLFAQQEEKTPNHIALVGVGEPQETHERNHHSSHMSHKSHMSYMSYKELNKKSHRLAFKLKEKGVKPGAIAAIMLERSVEMIIGILAILKAGAAYLPIDPDSPEKRTRYLLEDSGAILLATGDTGNTGGVSSYPSTPPIFPSSPLPSFSHLHQPPAPATSLAYVTYTSGSTGKSKGVMIEHGSVVNFINGITAIIPFNAADTILSLTTISFDIFGLETLLPLTTGTRVVIGGRKEQLDAAAAARLLVQERVTIFQVTPSRLQLLLLEKEIPNALKSLHFLLVGGETFPETLLEKARQIINGKIYNLYGPTETTIWSTVKDVTGKESLNIGKPMANTRVYIVDREMHPQPLGAAGELLIAGHGLARGYLNRPELTAEKFIMPSATRGSFEKPPLDPAKLLLIHHSPLTTHHSPIYRTGDLARWHPDGSIEFLGRRDFQVKIRGFRVEPGEIENRLQKHESINEAVILVKDAEAGKSGSKYLSAYIVADRELNVTELREYLLIELPAYMIPATFVKVDKIPLTSNGKVDRKTLESYGAGAALSTGVEFVAPRDNIEETIAKTWKELLNLEEVGIDENFFDLGGTSLDIYRLNLKLKEAFNEDEMVLKMLRYPTIRAFARYLSRKKIGLDDFQQLEGRSVPVNRMKKSRTYQKDKRKGSRDAET